MFKKIAQSEQIPQGELASFKLGDYEILLARSSQGIFAIEDRCPHLEQSLADGTLKDNTLTCRHHGVQIDISNGKILFSMGLLNLQPVQTFAIKEEDGFVLVQLPD